jgi:hypothetical protein
LYGGGIKSRHGGKTGDIMAGTYYRQANFQVAKKLCGETAQDQLDALELGHARYNEWLQIKAAYTSSEVFDTAMAEIALRMPDVPDTLLGPDGLAISETDVIKDFEAIFATMEAMYQYALANGHLATLRKIAQMGA